MRKLIIWGAGGHGKVVLDIARATGLYCEIAFVDDSCAAPGGYFCNCELLPLSEGFEALKARGYRCFVVAIGDNLVRERRFQEGADKGFDPATLIHPATVVSSSARIGGGSVVMPRAVVNAAAVIGRNCILNTGVIAEHDCHVGDHVHLAPGVVLGGNVTVEPCALLGIGTIVLPGMKIGSGAIVGAGAVVLDSVPPGTTSVGVPAKVLFTGSHNKSGSTTARHQPERPCNVTRISGRTESNHTVLISSAGRRIGLLECMRDALKGTGRIGTIDSSRTAPAAHIVDAAWCVSTCKSPSFLGEVLDLCIREHVSVLIPTIDPELPIYASARNQFETVGTIVCISSTDTVRIGSDKVATHEWLSRYGFPTVRQASPAEVLRARSAWALPLIAKPRNGSGSIGVRLIVSWQELELLEAANHDCIVQEQATGHEFTINVYVSREGECVCAVPHWRIEVRAGEVSKGITVKDPRLMSLGRRIAESLPGAYGPMNIQCFMDDSGDLKVIEINPRFGGGYPLAHKAGAPFAAWIIDELEGRKLSYFGDWQDGLAMLRYDNAVYVPGSALGIKQNA